MKKSIFLELLIFLAVCAGIYIGFRFVKIRIAAPDISLPKGSEEKIGNVILEQLLLTHPEIKNKRLESALTKIRARLEKPIGKPAYAYKIHVIASSDINALTLPGGHIIIFSGLIEQTDTPEELSAVLAHELGHSEKKHLVKKLVKTIGVEVVALILSGGDPTLITEVVKTMTSTVFDRAQETEADEFALQLLLDASISPRSLATFFRKLEEKSRMKGLSDKLEIISTHPGNENRYKNALAFPVPADKKFEKLDINWSAVKNSL